MSESEDLYTPWCSKFPCAGGKIQEVDVVVEEVAVAEVDAAEAFVEEVPLGVVEEDHLEEVVVASEAVEDHRVTHTLIICIRVPLPFASSYMH